MPFGPHSPGNRGPPNKRMQLNGAEGDRGALQLKYRALDGRLDREGLVDGEDSGKARDRADRR
jgi:hypothetical protein